jgi:hypothetical protein
MPWYDDQQSAQLPMATVPVSATPSCSAPNGAVIRRQS